MIPPEPRSPHVFASLPHMQSLPGEEDIYKVTLPNGITILARSNFNSPSVFLQGFISAGSILDPDDKLGLAQFTASALMRGAGGRDFQEIYDSLESAGASLAFSSGTLSTSFGGNALVEDLGLVLGLLSQALIQPEFPEVQVQRLQAQLLTSLALRSQDTAAMAALKFGSLLFNGHPYSRPDDGYTETVSTISPQDLVRFHERTYGPRGMFIVIVGGLEPQAAVDQAAKALSGWSNPAQAMLPELPELEMQDSVQRCRVTIAGKSQADIVMGVVAPERSSPDYLSLAAANDILGQFGLYGRIGESVRENAGLAYYAYSSLSAGIGPGAWYAAAGVDPGNTEEAIDLIQAEFRRIAQEPVREEELADTKTSFIGRLPLGLESNAGVASAILHLARYELGMDYYRHYPDLVQAVNREKILLTAQKYLDLDRMVIATAGPAE